MATALSGCTVVTLATKFWPKSHDPEMFGRLVNLDIQLEQVDCETSNWSGAMAAAEQVARYAEWRGDPQAENLRALHKHLEKLSQGGSPEFCELGKRLARQRVETTTKAWKGRSS